MLAATSDNEGAARERRCIATGAALPAEKLVRFVVSPDGVVVPDIDGKLPGRGLWLTANRTAFAKAIAKGDFSRAAKAKVTVAPDLADHVAHLLSERLKADLGMARRAGLADVGFDSVMRALDKKIPPAIMFHAAGSSDDGRRKLRSAVKSRELDVRFVDVLTRDELSLALGRENVVHAAIRPGVLAERLILNSVRLAGLKGKPSDLQGQQDQMGQDESTL
jgi:predicted RNA-binding protein YlxR (DUF448 family)